MVDGSLFAGEDDAVEDSVNEVTRAVKYFPNAVHLAVDWTIFPKIQCLQFYPQRPFSHHVDIAYRMHDQTWTFLGEHCATAAFSREWKCAISSRNNEVGSGRSRPAEKEAFAMAN